MCKIIKNFNVIYFNGRYLYANFYSVSIFYVCESLLRWSSHFYTAQQMRLSDYRSNPAIISLGYGLDFKVRARFVVCYLLHMILRCGTLIFDRTPYKILPFSLSILRKMPGFRLICIPRIAVVYFNH